MRVSCCTRKGLCYIWFSPRLYRCFVSRPDVFLCSEFQVELEFLVDSSVDKLFSFPVYDFPFWARK